MEIVKDLVSVVIPCYNMAGRIHRLFDSLLNQTYQKLHIILVNDGSTDNSEEVVLEYKKKFEEKGIEFQYILQKNLGLGGAVDKGLKYVKGEFFIWPDSDDWLTPDSVEVKCLFLKEHQDFGFVRSDAFVYLENDLKHPIDFMTMKHPNRCKTEHLVEDYIWERHILFCPGCHMIRTEDFVKVVPAMSIFPGKRGQNYQLLLPMLCNYKFGYIDKALYNYVIYEGSMSRGDNNIEKYLIRYNDLEEIMIRTFVSIDMDDNLRQKYLYMTRQKYFIRRAIMAYNFGDKDIFARNYVNVDNEYLNDTLKKAAVNIEKPLLASIHKLYYKIRTMLSTNHYRYKLNRIRFILQSRKYNDYPSK